MSDLSREDKDLAESLRSRGARVSIGNFSGSAQFSLSEDLDLAGLPWPARVDIHVYERTLFIHWRLQHA